MSDKAELEEFRLTFTPPLDAATSRRLQEAVHAVLGEFNPGVLLAAAFTDGEDPLAVFAGFDGPTEYLTFDVPAEFDSLHQLSVRNQLRWVPVAKGKRKQLLVGVHTPADQADRSYAVLVEAGLIRAARTTRPGGVDGRD